MSSESLHSDTKFKNVQLSRAAASFECRLPGADDISLTAGLGGTVSAESLSRCQVASATIHVRHSEFRYNRQNRQKPQIDIINIKYESLNNYPHISLWNI